MFQIQESVFPRYHHNRTPVTCKLTAPAGGLALNSCINPIPTNQFAILSAANKPKNEGHVAGRPAAADGAGENDGGARRWLTPQVPRLCRIYIPPAPHPLHQPGRGSWPRRSGHTCPFPIIATRRTCPCLAPSVFQLYPIISLPSPLPRSGFQPRALPRGSVRTRSLTRGPAC